MTTRPSAAMRREVVERAGNCCEYCLIHQDLVASTHQVDHVIAEKHEGQTTLQNLARILRALDVRLFAKPASSPPRRFAKAGKRKAYRFGL